MSEPSERRSFSQRQGLEAVPPQLQLGELPQSLRNQLHYPVYLDFRTCVVSSYDAPRLNGRWIAILRDYWVRVTGKNVADFDQKARGHENFLRTMFDRAPFNELFDFIEYLLAHSESAPELKEKLATILRDGRAAYRIVGKTVVPVGNDEQGEAIERAISEAAIAIPSSAKQLIAAGSELRAGNWTASVRESIHAVEAAAVTLAPDKNTLGAALSVLERRGHLHGSLKAAFSSLYGYTSDEEGIRHALVFQEAAQVDETDALFMLGACASFVSFLLARHRTADGAA